MRVFAVIMTNNRPGWGHDRDTTREVIQDLNPRETYPEFNIEQDLKIVYNPSPQVYLIFRSIL